MVHHAVTVEGANAPLLRPSVEQASVSTSTARFPAASTVTTSTYVVTVLAAFGLLALLGAHVFHQPMVNGVRSAEASTAYLPHLSSADAVPRAVVGTPAHTYVVNEGAVVDVKILRNVYQIGNPRSASTYQWYLLCSILRVVVDKDREVRCDESADGFWQPAPDNGAGVVRLFKIHPSKLRPGEGEWRLNHLPRVLYEGPDPTPETDIVFVSLKPDEGSDPAPLLVNFTTEAFTLAHTQVYQDFIEAGLGDLKSYARIFDLDKTKMMKVWEHMRHYSVMRQCCGVQASSLQRTILRGDLPSVTSDEGAALKEFHLGVGEEGELVSKLSRTRQDLDFMPCEAYNLNTVEKLFLQTELAREFPDKLYGAHVPHGYFTLFHRTPFTYRISSGYCAESLKQMRKGVDFNGLLHTEWMAGQIRKEHKRTREERQEERRKERQESRWETKSNETAPQGEKADEPKLGQVRW